MFRYSYWILEKYLEGLTCACWQRHFLRLPAQPWAEGMGDI